MKLQLYAALICFTFTVLPARRRPGTTWSGLPRTTVAERLATKYDAQAQGLRYSSGHGYRKMPRHSYRTYYKEHLAPHQSEKYAKLQKKRAKKRALLRKFSLEQEALL